MEVWEISEAHGLGHHLSSALECVLRHQRKGDPVADLLKAKTWIYRAITVKAPLRAGKVLDPTALIAPPSPRQVAQAFGLSERLGNVVAEILADEHSLYGLASAAHWLSLEVDELREIPARLHGAIDVNAYVRAVTALDEACSRLGLHWIFAQGRTRHDEALWGVSIHEVVGGVTKIEALVTGESDDPEKAVGIAISRLPQPVVMPPI